MPRILLPLSSCLLMLSCGSKEGIVIQSEELENEPETSSEMNSELNPEFESTLEKINALAPSEYPEIVTPLPDSKDLELIETDELMTMLESWNPSLREQAAKALSKRGQQVMDVLKESTSSDNWMVRAGSATALAAIIKEQLQNSKADQKDQIMQQHTDVISDFVRLCGDERLEVRVAALDGLKTVSPQTPDAAKAVLHLCNDPDNYLAQDAMMALDKQFSIESLEQEEVINAFKEALDSPLPRGKGHIVRIIKQMSPETQGQFAPDLVEHVAWKPRRDTMFAAGGQEDAIKMLTEMKDTAVIPHLPEAMGKIKRGGGLFDPCLDAARAFGRDAKVILPQLKAIHSDIKANGENAKIRPNRDQEASLKKLEDTIDYLESL